MHITITGRHMPVSDSLRAYAEEKISKVAKIHDRDDMSVDVVLHVEKNPSNKNRDVAEVTAHMKGIVVRAEEAAPEMYAAIDLVSEKLERQMRKYKTKLVDRRNGKIAVKTAPGDTEICTRAGGRGARRHPRQGDRHQAHDRGRGDLAAGAAGSRLLRVHSRRGGHRERAVPPHRRGLRADSAETLSVVETEAACGRVRART